MVKDSKAKHVAGIILEAGTRPLRGLVSIGMGLFHSCEAAFVEIGACSLRDDKIGWVGNVIQNGMVKV